MVRKLAITIISASVKILFICAVVCLLYYGGTKGFEFGVSIFSPKAMEESPGTDVEFSIKKGMNAEAIGKKLEESGLIEDYKVFFIQSKLYGYSFNEGDYVLNTSMTTEDMLNVIGTLKKD